MGPAVWGIRTGPITLLQHKLALAVLSRSPALRRKLANAADLASFYEWKREVFGEVKTARTKPGVWKAISARIRASAEPWHVLEFGVAFGYATDWWISHHDESVIETWDGFDRFTGLPTQWRDVPAGGFDAQGQPPPLEDPRIAWHVGDIADTIGEMDAARIARGRRFVYFDLDLYEPSKVAWDWVAEHLRAGDILYFDEAFDPDERRLLNESVLPIGTFKYLGGTETNLAIEIVALH